MCIFWPGLVTFHSLEIVFFNRDCDGAGWILRFCLHTERHPVATPRQTKKNCLHDVLFNRYFHLKTVWKTHSSYWCIYCSFFIYFKGYSIVFITLTIDDGTFSWWAKAYARRWLKSRSVKTGFAQVNSRSFRARLRSRRFAALRATPGPIIQLF